MKKRNIAAAILLASMMAVSTCAVTSLTAVAADTNHTMSVGTVTNDVATHQYVAYRIFKADLATIGSEQQLVDIDWATDVDGPTIIAALKANSTFGSGESNEFYNCDTAAKVANVLETFGDNSTKANAFADVLNGVLTADSAGLGTGINLESNTVPGPGYYFIKDTIPTLPSGTTQYAYSDHILKVLRNTDLTNIVPKADVPTLGKKIGSVYNSGVEANTASVGDTVNYVLDSKVPDMTGYTKYFYVINDDMEAGLTFDPSSVHVTIGGTELKNHNDSTLGSATTWFEVQTGTTSSAADYAGGHTFQIVFNNFIQYAKDDVITVTYSATVNNNATAGNSVDSANTNTVNLTFSNNPNVSSSGTNEPEGSDPVGTTPNSTTYTYLTELEILKVDASDHTKKLGGAVFQLTGDSLQAVTTSGGAYRKNSTVADGDAWYLLKDGTYTRTAPTTETASSYASTTDKYEYVESTTTGYADINKVDAYGTTSSTDGDTKGTVKFGKLGAGTYTLKEVQAPAGGYNLLADPITVTITATPTSTGCTWSYQKDSETATNSYQITVANSKGMTLPSTGGIGTTIFYVVGGTLVAGAVVLLITKKRMSINDQK